MRGPRSVHLIKSPVRTGDATEDGDGLLGCALRCKRVLLWEKACSGLVAGASPYQDQDKRAGNNGRPGLLMSDKIR
jgi:hypothetical protein